MNQLVNTFIILIQGLNFEPKLTVNTTSIEYNVEDETSYSKYIKRLDQLFDTYKKQTEPQYDVRDCSFDEPPPPDLACHVPLNKFGPCGGDNKYGFTSSKPCIFLQFNRILDWLPEYYEPTDQLPSNMPDSLQRAMTSNTKFIFSVSGVF